jgi:quercetin dioxygenase-like cupin family protein
VHVVTRDIPAGEAIPWHTHPGVEIAYVESGNVELEVAGKGKQVLSPGGHFMVPRGVVHSGRNVGSQPARLVITYVVDKDAPLRSPAEPPVENGPNP